VTEDKPVTDDEAPAWTVASARPPPASSNLARLSTMAGLEHPATSSTR